MICSRYPYTTSCWTLYPSQHQWRWEPAEGLSTECLSHHLQFYTAELSASLHHMSTVYSLSPKSASTTTRPPLKVWSPSEKWCGSGVLVPSFRLESPPGGSDREAPTLKCSKEGRKREEENGPGVLLLLQVGIPLLGECDQEAPALRSARKEGILKLYFKPPGEARAKEMSGCTSERDRQPCN